MGVFNRNQDPKPQLKRNAYDMSFANHLTLNFGGLYPCFCKEVIPGDTAEINTAFALRALPTLFPVQTKMRVNVKFFYQRNRNLYNEWTNLITNNPVKKGIPYFDNSSSWPKTGSLGDYFGLPTTVSVNNYQIDTDPESMGLTDDYYGQYDENVLGTIFNPIASNLFGTLVKVGPTLSPCSSSCYGSQINSFVLNVSSGNKLRYTLMPRPNPYKVYDVSTIYLCDVDSREFIASMTYDDSNDDGTYFVSQIASDVDPKKHYTFNFFASIENPPTGVSFNQYAFFNSVEFTYKLSGNLDLKESPLSSDFHISALPFRAYESIYNAFYRDDRNNPYTVNGEIVANQFLASTDGGLDNLTNYPLRYVNWEQDFLTTATSSPQQGAAPLVGITSTGEATFNYDGKSYTATLQTAEDGDTVVSGTFKENVPTAVARSLVNVATSGISINDFRNVNALQRYLETNLRKGLRYKDQIEGRFGVDMDFAALDMPEFIGGATTIIDSTQVNNTSESVDTPLGSYAGQLSAFGMSKHKVTKYCDEHGYIIGIIDIVPIPSYSDLIPKHFFKFDKLDFFTPEFAYIGKQPITLKEVATPHIALSGDDIYNDVFGYQRAWYDYLSSQDEVHGLFRSELSSFVVRRVFNSIPKLSPEFLTVHPSDLTSVFASETNSGDKFLGQLYFDCTFKRPIPRFGIPRLE